MIIFQTVILIFGMIGLVSLIFYDLRYFIIPDKILWGLFFLLLIQNKVSLSFLSSFFLGIGSLLLKQGMEFVLQKRVLGWGDIKLVSLLGLGINISDIPLFLLCVGFLGCLWGSSFNFFYKKSIFPFAPCLILGFLLINKIYPMINLFF